MYYVYMLNIFLLAYILACLNVISEEHSVHSFNQDPIIRIIEYTDNNPT